MEDPAQLLDRAWAMEPPLRLQERYAALDRLERLLADPVASPAAVEGRDWQLELLAERAIDHAANVRLEKAIEIADQVLAQGQSAGRIAISRATLAKARAVAWQGTEEKRLAGERLLEQATQMFEELGHREWYGFAVFWRAHAIYFEAGHLIRSAELMREALEILDADSPRRPVVLDFYADTTTRRGARTSTGPAPTSSQRAATPTARSDCSARLSVGAESGLRHTSARRSWPRRRRCSTGSA
jgi:tetratricopeptide (TPR) repeat protein